MKKSQSEDRDWENREAITNYTDISNRVFDLAGHLLSHPMYDTTCEIQMGIQEYDIEEVQESDTESIVYETDDYVIIQSDEIWETTDAIPEQDLEATEESLKLMTQDLYHDLAREDLGDEEVSNLTDEAGLAIVFVE